MPTPARPRRPHLLVTSHPVGCRNAACLQNLVGHRDVATVIYTHVLNRGPFAVRGPPRLMP
jgi:hypothetical protein